MTLLSYQVFQMVVKQGSFQKAAQVLNLTPSAVSHAVSSMEQELGFPLFVRNKKGIVLTSYGEQLMPYIHAVLQTEETLQQAIDEVNGLQKGSIRIGCFSSVCTNWIADIVHTFWREYPSIEIEIYQGTYADVSAWLKNGVADIGFLSASSAGDLPFEPLYEDPLLCVVPMDYVKQDDSGVMGIEEMRGQRFVSQREETDADITNFFRDNGLNVHASCHVVDDLSTVAMVAEGFGICILPELVMKDIPYAVKTYPVEPKASRIIGISALNPELLAPAAKILYEHVIKRYTF